MKLNKLIDIWLYIWIFIVPVIAIYNIHLSQKLIKKIEKVELQQQSIDMLFEVKKLVNMMSKLMKLED